MTNLKHILDQRTKKSTNAPKMEALARQSAAGQLTSFAGVFSITELSQREKEALEAVLRPYAPSDDAMVGDLPTLFTLASEVKAIHNQAALLHGERIKHAQRILTRYREGAFTAWLIAVYGNRQTPYNFLQYFEFCESMPKELRPQIEWMPRQAIYTLASREGSLEEKQNIVSNYRGEKKTEILAYIRQKFPLGKDDQRQVKHEEQMIRTLHGLCDKLTQHTFHWTPEQRSEMHTLLAEIHHLARLS